MILACYLPGRPLGKGLYHVALDICEFLFSDFTQILNTIFNYNGSVNFYMFHGGTNFGFMNGANHIDNYAGNGFPSLQKNKAVFPFYAPDVTSYGMYVCM